jgi:hypothetical protein
VLADTAPGLGVTDWPGGKLVGLANGAAGVCVADEVWATVYTAVNVRAIWVGAGEVADGWSSVAVSCAGWVGVRYGVMEGVELAGGMVGTVWNCRSALPTGAQKSKANSSRPRIATDLQACWLSNGIDPRRMWNKHGHQVSVYPKRE